MSARGNSKYIQDPLIFNKPDLCLMKRKKVSCQLKELVTVFGYFGAIIYKCRLTNESDHFHSELAPRGCLPPAVVMLQWIGSVGGRSKLARLSPAADRVTLPLHWVC